MEIPSKWYQRIGLLFVLFMARTLEAEAKPDDVYDDPNLLWWHRLGRPTLESCMQKLAAQHEERQQQQQAH